ncbi:adhesion G protein-coupled receptor G3-like [Epinephelus fuscoguttatus]|uniref:adhesion G protein-coupled receptor G3-like n=1 Tax=Epinephelus fuscoguttatus TaxID=293821 RepID=UPI0020D189E6|nr:adhesion G protein-coupled receptor G3-like [Epinephelus fuscoguttatus]
MMWITLFLVTLVWVSTTQADGPRSVTPEENGVTYGTVPPSPRDSDSTYYCENVLRDCETDVLWIRCYEKGIGRCIPKRRGPIRDFILLQANSSQEAEVSPTSKHRVYIPSSALRRSREDESREEEVRLVASVVNSTFFKLSPPQRRPRGRHFTPVHIQGTVLGGLVLVVKVGKYAVQNLPEPVKLTFQHNKEEVNGTCVFWQESHLDNTTGHWSAVGCETSDTGTDFICSCNHLSFFAVLVNPELSVDESDAVKLSYITYTGSALSIFFTVISLIIYICLQRRRPEKAIGVHLQLTVALLCLHIIFLLSNLWVWQLNETEDSWVCRGLGLLLHWSLLATFSWAALEGFHLYLLLIRVFNIYVRRYLLKLSLVGWGLPTLIAVVCGISGVYGKFNPESEGVNISNSPMQLCWMSRHRLLVSYITTVAFPCLVILCNSCMLVLVVFKFWGLRAGSGAIGSSSGWRRTKRENRGKLWKDCATVLGLSCVLGLPWGLATISYITIPGIYIFTILISLQGVYMFLWSVALNRKSRSDYNSSTKDPSSQKVMTTSFNN